MAELENEAELVVFKEPDVVNGLEIVKELHIREEIETVVVFGIVVDFD